MLQRHTMDKNIQTDECSEDSLVPVLSEDGNSSTESLKCADKVDVGHSLLNVIASAHEKREEEKSLAKFHDRISNLLLETNTKLLEEAQAFSTAACDRTSFIVTRIKHKNAEEHANLLHQLKRLKLYCDSLESSMKKKDSLIFRLIGNLEYKEEKLIMSRAFNEWRRYMEARRRKNHLSAIAENHYDQILKKRTFNHWRESLKTSWKKRIELQANVEVLDAQKQVVNLYENKIRNLEDNLNEAGKKLDKLMQTKLRACEDVPQPAPPRPSEPQYNHNRFYSAENINQNPYRYRTMFTRPDTSPALCSECSTQAHGGLHAHYYTCPGVPPTTYMVNTEEAISEVVPSQKPCHPSFQLQSMPVMGTANVRHQGTGTKKSCDIQKPSKSSSIMVERHIPRNQVMTGMVSSLSTKPLRR